MCFQTIRVIKAAAEKWLKSNKENSVIDCANMNWLSRLEQEPRSAAQWILCTAIMANPRKFSEKIALHTHRQAEETAAFEKIMKEVSDVKVR